MEAGVDVAGKWKKLKLEQRCFDPSSVLQWIRECAGSAAGRLMPCSPPKGRTGRKGPAAEVEGAGKQLQAGAQQVKSDMVESGAESFAGGSSSSCRSYAGCLLL